MSPAAQIPPDAGDQPAAAAVATTGLGPSAARPHWRRFAFLAATIYLNQGCMIVGLKLSSAVLRCGSGAAQLEELCEAPTAKDCVLTSNSGVLVPSLVETASSTADERSELRGAWAHADVFSSFYFNFCFFKILNLLLSYVSDLKKSEKENIVLCCNLYCIRNFTGNCACKILLT